MLDKSCKRESRLILFSVIFSTETVPLWDNVEIWQCQATNGNIVWRRKMCCACWVAKERIHAHTQTLLTPIVVNSSTECFVVWQQCWRNPLLYFHGNSEHFCITDNYICAISNKKGTTCFDAMATVVTWMILYIF